MIVSLPQKVRVRYSPGIIKYKKTERQSFPAPTLLDVTLHQPAIGSLRH